MPQTGESPLAASSGGLVNQLCLSSVIHRLPRLGPLWPHRPSRLLRGWVCGEVLGLIPYLQPQGLIKSPAVPLGSGPGFDLAG